MDDFDFIRNENLRVIIKGSIEYIYALLEGLKNGEKSELYREETYRTIILYVISIIEAILLYFYKEINGKIEYSEYKFMQYLSENYICKEKDNLPIIVAAEEKIVKKDYQISLHDLVKFFRGKKLIRREKADEILELNDIRNTFHFNKPRDKGCNINHVERALKLLVHTIKKHIWH